MAKQTDKEIAYPTDPRKHKEEYKGWEVCVYHFREGCHDRYFGQMRKSGSVMQTIVLHTEDQALETARNTINGKF